MIGFGQCLRAYLEQNNLSQSELARRLKRKQPTINYYLSLEETPKRKTVEWIAAAIGAEPADIMDPIRAGLYRESRQREQEKQIGSSAHAAVCREPMSQYNSRSDPWLAWSKQLRVAYRRDPAKIELSVRAAWPEKTAQQILVWLNTNSKR